MDKELRVVAEVVPVGVAIVGVGAGRGLADAVAEPIPVGVGIEGVGAQGHLRAVEEAIEVRIGVEGVGAQGHLRAVLQAVEVGIGVGGVGAEDDDFLAVDERVEVRIGIEGVGAVDSDLIGVAEAVAVCVNECVDGGAREPYEEQGKDQRRGSNEPEFDSHFTSPWKRQCAAPDAPIGD